MKKEIHPETHEINARCVCGNAFATTSTKSDILVDICALCHPFFTGTQKFIDTAGRIERFQTRYQAKAEASLKEAKPKKKTAAKKK